MVVSKGYNMSTRLSVNSLGHLYSKQHKLGEAEAIRERALAGYDKALGTKKYRRRFNPPNARAPVRNNILQDELDIIT